MTPDAAAMAIARIANNNMVGALRSVLIERGLDPRDFTLMRIRRRRAAACRRSDAGDWAFRTASFRTTLGSSRRTASFLPMPASTVSAPCSSHRNISIRRGQRG